MNSLSVSRCVVDGLAARCGTLIVPEDRLTGKGRAIPVRYVVIPATGPDRLPDPVVWFAGGPGDSAVADIPGELPLLGSLNVHRDLVFIEQRGTGSSNPLNCPAFRGSLADKPALRASVESCLAHLNGDLRFYTTAMFTDDVNQLLGDLHYAKVNLIGISYGTTAEQVFLLRHPDRVRTMTLISGTPLDVPLVERLPENSELALRYVLASCEAQADCQQAFPHLAADWTSLWTSLGKSPVVVPASQSPAKTVQMLDQDSLAALLYQAMFVGDLSPIPIFIHTLAVAKNKAAALVSLSTGLQEDGEALPSPGSGTQPMLLYSIECSEPWFRNDPGALSGQRSSFAYQMDVDSAQWWQYVCAMIPKSAAAVGYEELTLSKVPVLALNGDADPIDQPGNMALAREFWPDSLAVRLPGQGHDTNGSWQVCGGPLAEAFIAQGSVAGLDTSCLSVVPPTAFLLSLP